MQDVMSRPGQNFIRSIRSHRIFDGYLRAPKGPQRRALGVRNTDLSHFLVGSMSKSKYALSGTNFELEMALFRTTCPIQVTAWNT